MTTPDNLEKEKQLNFKIKKEICSNNNQDFIVFFDTESESKLSIKAIKHNFTKKVYTNTFSVEEIQQNKYFYQFDNLKEICDELSIRISKEKISINEGINSIVISINLPSSKIKEIIFELKENDKYDKELIQGFMNILDKQKQKIAYLQKEINKIKNYLDYFFYALSLIILLLSIIIYYYNRKNVYYISNLDSLIIKDNNNYNHYIKNWISPNSKIKANLLYRLSRDGPEISTFHNLCDYKGPATLVLFYLINGEKVGFFVNGFFDSISIKKYDKNSFLFNLNQNKMYKKLDNDQPAFYCYKDYGPRIYGFGCKYKLKLNYINYSIKHIDESFEKASKLIPPEKEGKKDEESKIEYPVLEIEIFQIFTIE